MLVRVVLLPAPPPLPDSARPAASRVFFLAQEICSNLDGVFAFVMYDAKTDCYVAGRDPIGVNPL